MLKLKILLSVLLLVTLGLSLSCPFCESSLSYAVVVLLYSSYSPFTTSSQLNGGCVCYEKTPLYIITMK